METEKEQEKWREFNDNLSHQYLKETGAKRVDITRADMVKFIAWLKEKIYVSNKKI